jgi:hypothetical protein
LRCGHGIYGEVEVGEHAMDAIATAEHISLGCSLGEFHAGNFQVVYEGYRYYLDFTRYRVESFQRNVPYIHAKLILFPAQQHKHSAVLHAKINRKPPSKSCGDNATRSSAQSKLSVCVYAKDSIEYPKRVMMKQDAVLKTQLAPVRL